jgi:hypothetical protein
MKSLTLRKQSKTKSRKQTKSNRVSRTKKNLKSRSLRLSKKHNKKNNKKNNKKHNNKHNNKLNNQRGGECEYIKVQGMTLPDLKIPDQYALLSENCQSTPTQSTVNHPNINQ